MPIRTPRLLIRPKQPGDGALSAAAVAETWTDLHQWMEWAERLEDNTGEQQEQRTRDVIAKFDSREELNMVGVELATEQLVIWCGLHSIDWASRSCDTGYWVRKSAQGRGFATESTNAMLRYAFLALGMHRVGIAHADGNQASQRVIEKLGFSSQGVQHGASQLPGGRVLDRHCYARFDLLDLPPLAVRWGER